jgi:hypothetical protein
MNAASTVLRDTRRFAAVLIGLIALGLRGHYYRLRQTERGVER